MLVNATDWEITHLNENTLRRVSMYRNRAQEQLDKGRINNARRALEMVELIKAGRI